MRSNSLITVDLAPYLNNAGIASFCDPDADGLDGMPDNPSMHIFALTLCRVEGSL